MGVVIGAAAIGAGVSLLGGIMSDQSSKKAAKKAAKAQAEESQRGSQWAAYRDEMARKWELQDMQRQQNFKEDAVRSFAQFASPELQKLAPPERTVVDTEGLANFDPNDLKLNMANRNKPAVPATGGAGGAAQGGNGRALGQLR